MGARARERRMRERATNEILSNARNARNSPAHKQQHIYAQSAKSLRGVRSRDRLNVWSVEGGLCVLIRISGSFSCRAVFRGSGRRSKWIPNKLLGLVVRSVECVL